MPFIAPVIAGAIGLGAIGSAVIGAAISVGVGLLARALTPKPEPVGLKSSPLRLTLDSDPPREIIFGRAATAGHLVYHNTYGNKNSTLQLVIALADHPCESLDEVWVNGELRSWNPGTGVVDGFNGKLFVVFYDGSQTTAPEHLVDTSDGLWSSTDCFRNGAWVLVEAIYDDKAFPGGIPKFVFVLKGAKLYDWRKDTTAGGSGAHRWDNQATWEWSDNPLLAWYLVRRGYYVNGERIFGMETPAAALPLAAATTAANACDALVDLAAGGTEKRYTVNGVMQCEGVAPREAIRAILSACAGKEIDSGGEVRLLPGVAQSPAMSLTDGDLISTADLEFSPHRPRSQLVNAVFGSFRDRTQMYKRISLPPRISSDDEEADGGRFDTTYDLAYVTGGTQGQRVMEILRRLGRQQATVSATVRARFAVLEAGDWISWTSSRFGWDSKTFEVISVAVNPDLTVSLKLQEISSSVYAWAEDEDELDLTAPSDLPSGGPPDADIENLDLDYALLTTPTDEQRPGLHLTWDPPEDPTIDYLVVQYRAVGSVAAPLEISVLDPESGSHTWISGVQGGIQYEARVRAVTTPPRPADWSSWIQATGTSSATITLATVADDTITPAKLSPQARFELGLATAIEAGLGSLPNLKQQIEDLQDRIAEAQLESLELVARTRTELAAETASSSARVKQESVARASDDRAVAAFITGVSTEVLGQSSSIQETLASIDGQGARWAVVAQQDGKIIGMVQLNGEGTETDFTVVADKFRVAQPGEDGGDPIPVFEIGEVEGVPSLTFKGNMFGDGAILARHLSVLTLSAITANIGTVTAGRIESTDGNSFIDLDSGEFQFAAEI